MGYALMLVIGFIMGAVTVIAWGYILSGSEPSPLPAEFSTWKRCGYCQGRYSQHTSTAAVPDDFCCSGCEAIWLNEHVRAA